MTLSDFRFFTFFLQSRHPTLTFALRSAFASFCHQVSDASGSMQVTVVKGENPFLQGDLLSDECFILDHGKNNIIFVWKGWCSLTPAGGLLPRRLCGVTRSCLVESGRNANPSERKEAMKTAEGFIQQMGYPANTQVPLNSTFTPLSDILYGICLYYTF